MCFGWGKIDPECKWANAVRFSENDTISDSKPSDDLSSFEKALDI